MTGSQYIVDSLIRKQVTDAFGIPGGVILPFLYALDERKEEIMPHLSYHEQCAGFAANGFAQASGKLGVAYATRGPGFTNLITAITDAYYDSLPVLFITAHTSTCPPEGMRIMEDQEMDTCSMVRNITKKAVRLDDIDTFAVDFEELCNIALSGRKGPVFLDVSTMILNKEVNTYTQENEKVSPSCNFDINFIIKAIREAKRPVILAGDGINQANARELFRSFVQKSKIPVISSRFSHDLLGDSDLYYGYVGSHGMRCANFILSKTDLILSLGNRLHFPPRSETFGEILNHAKVIRCEIDEGEFNREIPNSINVQADVVSLLNEINHVSDLGDHSDWNRICDILKKELIRTDVNSAVEAISDVLKIIPSNFTITNDVGNNEFWVSRACALNHISNRTYYSKSFGALGSGLGKAIGIYYATKQPVVCFVGDQGIQMNIQELQFISQHKLPILIVIINNGSSGMIKDREADHYDYFLHTTNKSGFSLPSFKGISCAYGIKYQLLDDAEKVRSIDVERDQLPTIWEILVDEKIVLTPNLPRGMNCQNMYPALLQEKYNYLNQL